ncbi:MAG TPA: hypothetical protein VIL74_10670 [Pyrinomonadaceae bacterium]|jgi:hypothetical protein
MKGIIDFIGADKKIRILGLILLAIAAVSAGCATRAETARPTAPEKETAATTETPGFRYNRDPYSDREFDGDFEYSTPPKPAVILTKASFAKIQTGMTLAEVEKTLGGEGLLVSMMNVNGRKTQIYKWSNHNFTSYIDVTIENGKVVEKKDKGLK